MNCTQCLDFVNNLLASERMEPVGIDVRDHLAQCRDCSRQYASSRQAVMAVTPSRFVPVPVDFKKRVMQAIATDTALRALKSPRIWPQARKWRMPLAAAAILLITLSLVFYYLPHRDGTPMAFSLLQRAVATEGEQFAGDKIVHQLHQITVTATKDAQWAASRWLPMSSLDASGKMRFHQLSLAAKPGEQYIVDDECWYDPPTGRFVRLLTSGKQTLFANAFDGTAIYTLEAITGGAPKVVREPVAKDFKRPKDPAGFLGSMANTMQVPIDPKNKNLVHDDGTTTLDDGAEGRILRLVMPNDDDKQAPGAPAMPFYRITIRSATNAIEKVEFVQGKEPLLVIQPQPAKAGENPPLGWDLAGLKQPAASAPAATGPGIRADMVVQGITIEQMVKHADFTTYVFIKDPAWAAHGPIIDDVLDVASPPHRMFSISYPAKDKRHVVLIQSPTYNEGLGPMAKKGKLLYTSPAGVKVWDVGERGPRLAKILLQSAQYNLKDPPSKDITGYLLETPAATFPALAINGQITDEELHALIDTLSSARDTLKQP